MKLNINRSLKKALIIITILLICAISFLLYNQIKYPGSKEEKVVLYNYNNKANINYKVFLKPNILYSDTSIGEGNTYITEFVDHIDAVFNYEFKGERIADIKGDYEVIASVEGYTAEKESEKTIWKKDFVLLSKTSFDINDKTISIKKDIPIKFQDYQAYAKKVIQDSKVSSQVKLSVFMNINLNTTTDKGIIKETISPSMVMPLNVNYFEIKGDLSKEKPDAIKATNNSQVAVNIKTVLCYSVILVVLIIALVYLIFFTSVITVDDPLAKKLNKIFKEHGDRLVALNSEVSINYENYNKVKSIDDLVRIADEIGKPIMYKFSSDYNDITEFYVIDNTQMYIFKLEDILSELNVEKCKTTDTKS